MLGVTVTKFLIVGAKVVITNAFVPDVSVCFNTGANLVMVRLTSPGTTEVALVVDTVGANVEVVNDSFGGITDRFN